MRKYKYEDEKLKFKTIICNKCGEIKVYGAADLAIYLDYNCRMNNISISFDYRSSLNGNWKFDLCDDCLLEFIKTFKYAPEGFMRASHLLDLDDERYKLTFENWKITGEWEDLKYLTYDELIECRGFRSDDEINGYIEKYHSDKPLLE